MPTKQLKAFTLAEMLVTLALTSILVSFCYMSYNYVQQLLKQFSQQSFFVTQLNELDRRGQLLANAPGLILKEDEHKLVFKSDSLNNSLEFRDGYLLMQRFGQTDTFRMENKAPDCSYETLSNPEWQNRLVNAIDFDVYFQKQKFHLTFHKNYDALTRLKLEKEN